MLDMVSGGPGRRHRRPMRSARSPRTARARCWSLGDGRAPAGPRRSRCGSRRSPARGVAPGARARPRPARAPRAARLRERAETLLDRPHEELWIRTYEEAAEALLREFAPEAGLDPFFTTVGPADRLAILLDRLDELPLRRHEIRGNPAGLLARLLRRIDLLKAEAVAPAALREWAVARGARRLDAGRARARRARDRVRRALRPPRPDPARGRQPRRRRPGARARQAAGRTAPTSPSEVGRALRPRARRRARGRRRRPPRGARGGRARTATWSAPAIPAQATRRFRGAGEAPLAAFRAAHPEAAEIDLEQLASRAPG